MKTDTVNFKPILFSTAMVQALLDGRKTQTRRIVKGIALEWLQPNMFTPEYVSSSENNLCPYGQAGDILWVRETFVKIDIDEEFQGRRTEYAYRASFEQAEEKYGSIMNPLGKRFIDSWKWKPSIFMPKEACRLFLKIDSIKIERLYHISDEDSIAEGIQREEKSKSWKDYFYTDIGNCLSPTASYITLWQSINNGFDPIDDNPWVWVVTFKKIDRPSNFLD